LRVKVRRLMPSAVSFCHMLNDIMQSLLSAIYPMLKENYGLDFWQIGLLTFTFQVTASLLQPAIGMYTDKRPLPYSLPVGMGSSLVGLLVPRLRHAATGCCCSARPSSASARRSSIPNRSRVARLASGGRYGLAQSLFQVGGNFGRRSGRCSPPSSSCRAASRASAWFALGSRSSASSSCGGSGAGMRAPPRRRPHRRRRRCRFDAHHHHRADGAGHADASPRTPTWRACRATTRST
jgi:MFS family permease